MPEGVIYRFEIIGVYNQQRCCVLLGTHAPQSSPDLRFDGAFAQKSRQIVCVGTAADALLPKFFCLNVADVAKGHGRTLSLVIGNQMDFRPKPKRLFGAAQAQAGCQMVVPAAGRA